jgi:uncharacterized membrane protein
MKRLKIVLASLALAAAFLPAARAQDAFDPTSPEGLRGASEPPPPIEFSDDFYRAKVLEATDDEIHVRMMGGPDEGTEQVIVPGPNSVFLGDDAQKVGKGDGVLVGSMKIDGKKELFIADHDRLPALIVLAIVFCLVVVWFSRGKGLLSLIALAGTAIVIIEFILPRIAQGHDPFLTVLSAAAGIAVFTMYLGHGWELKTHVALGGLLITLGLSAVISWALVASTSLFGLGTDSAAYLQTGPFADVDLRGLLLGGILLGALGVLDDVTAGQAATIQEVAKANPRLDFFELYRSGINVGREHVASLVNTLFLAYTGVSLPMFLAFKANAIKDFWLILNSEFMAEEIVRTLSGSLALILAVPITTALAAFFMSSPKSIDPRPKA